MAAAAAVVVVGLHPEEVVEAVVGLLPLGVVEVEVVGVVHLEHIHSSNEEKLLQKDVCFMDDHQITFPAYSLFYCLRGTHFDMNKTEDIISYCGMHHSSPIPGGGGGGGGPPIIGGGGGAGGAPTFTYVHEQTNKQTNE